MLDIDIIQPHNIHSSSACDHPFDLETIPLPQDIEKLVRARILSPTVSDADSHLPLTDFWHKDILLCPNRVNKQIEYAQILMYEKEGHLLTNQEMAYKTLEDALYTLKVSSLEEKIFPFNTLTESLSLEYELYIKSLMLITLPRQELLCRKEIESSPHISEEEALSLLNQSEWCKLKINELIDDVAHLSRKLS